ncbi:MAG: transglycosylase SLT domain-containing protein [Peptococcaceae bacterium]|nr:transglycosylase SLT domain-containing protein [Peptococcaceae bacterium]
MNTDLDSKQKAKTKTKTKTKVKRQAYILLITLVLLVPANPAPAVAAQNPPPQEIAAIFDKVAKEYEVPAEILKAIAYVETGWRQWDKNGNVVINRGGNPDYIGIMQVGTYNPKDKATVNKLKNDIEFNIAYGAKTLLAKWEMTPQIGDGDKSKLENWYFAIWAYNSWSARNNPHNNPQAYQEKILKLIASGYYYGIVEPVQITPMPKAWLPKGRVPSAQSDWKTPEPVHYAAFSQEVLSKAELQAIQSVPRVCGDSRIETSLKIATDGWPHGCKTVIIAQAEDYLEALAGAALAKKYKAPIILNPQNCLDPKVADTLLNKLKPLQVIILGGSQAISAEVEQELRELLSWTDDIVRFGGEDCYETAALIAAEFPEDCDLALSTDADFPDALSLATAAAGQAIPLLLTTENELPEATIKALQAKKPKNIYIAGNEDAISEQLVAEIAELTQVEEENIIRFAEANRYQTSAAIARHFYPLPEQVYLVTGQEFPDVLAGSALAVNNDAPLLLMPATGPAEGSVTEQYIEALSEQVEFKVLGGQTVLPDKTLLKILTLAGHC